MITDFFDWKPHAGAIRHENCSNCYYSQEDKGTSYADSDANFTCHRSSPTIHPGLDEEGIGWWPTISAHGWCGEWRRMPTLEKPHGGRLVITSQDPGPVVDRGSESSLSEFGPNDVPLG